MNNGCPRESMKVLPNFMQPFLTWLTAMPYVGQHQLIKWTPWSLLCCAIAEIVLGISIGAVGIRSGVWLSVFLVPLSWILTTGGVRMLFVVIEHSCCHHIFSKNKTINILIAEFISTIFWTQNYHAFKAEHATHHRVTRMSSDPDTLTLNEWGFYRDMDKGCVIKQVLRTVVSPRFHFESTLERVWYSTAGHVSKKILSPLIIAGSIIAVWLTDAWIYWIALWILPITILFNVSMLLNILTEHRWPAREKKRDLESVCYGRFCGEAVPNVADSDSTTSLWKWTKWWVRLFLVYLPYRLFVLVGDEPHHDFHHRQPNSDWANATYERHNTLMLSNADKHGEYSDVWGSLLDHLHASASTYQKTQTTSYTARLEAR